MLIVNVPVADGAVTAGKPALNRPWRARVPLVREHAPVLGPGREGVDGHGREVLLHLGQSSMFLNAGSLAISMV